MQSGAIRAAARVLSCSNSFNYPFGFSTNIVRFKTKPFNKRANMLRPHLYSRSLNGIIYGTVRSFTSTTPTSSSSPSSPAPEATATPTAPLAGKTCLITGGSSGIGLGIARRFLAADAGAANVVLLARRKVRLSDAVGALMAPSRSPLPSRRAGEEGGVVWDVGDGGGPAIARHGRVTLVAGDVGREVWGDKRVLSILVGAVE